jgi:hypothetical protein
MRPIEKLDVLQSFVEDIKMDGSFNEYMFLNLIID